MIHCAQPGIDSTGVTRPLISTKSITKKNITNIACCMVSELLAITTPMPDIVRMKSAAARQMAPNEPMGTSP